MDILVKARDLAHSAHCGQSRKDGSPFIGHPEAVAEILGSAGFDEEVLAAALLHDVVEHSGVGLDEIEAGFTEMVQGLVLALTEDESIDDYSQRKRVQRALVKQTGSDAVAIFAADKLANVIDLRRAYEQQGERVGELFEAGLDVRIELWQEDLEMAEHVAPSLPYLRELRYQLEALEEDRASK